MWTSRARQREYESLLLRRTFRDGGKVQHETLAQPVARCPPRSIELVRAVAAGRAVRAGGAPLVGLGRRSLPHGHVAAVLAQATALGLPALLGPAGRDRDLALALIVSRVVAPGARSWPPWPWWADTTLGADLGVAEASHRRGVRGDGLAARPPGRHRGRAGRRHLAAGGQPVAGWRCSTCPRPGWRARTARWPRAATPATARRASRRSSTGCSPTRPGGRSRSGSSPATPPTRPRSSRPSRSCGTSSGWPSW